MQGLLYEIPVIKTENIPDTKKMVNKEVLECVQRFSDIDILNALFPNLSERQVRAVKEFTYILDPPLSQRKSVMLLASTQEFFPLQEKYDGKPFLRKVGLQGNELYIAKMLYENPQPNVVTIYKVTDEYIDEELLDVKKSFDMKELFKARKQLLSLGVAFIDWHCGNVGVSADGQVKVFDFDISGVMNREGGWMLPPRSPSYSALYREALEMGIEDPLGIDKYAFDKMGKNKCNNIIQDIIESGFTPLLEILLDIESDIKIGRRFGFDPIYTAATYNDPDMVKLLLKNGVDPNEPDLEGDTPLARAFANGSYDAAKVLLENGVDPNVSWGGIPVFLRFASLGDVKVTEMLIKAGIDVDMQDERGRTALARTLIFEHGGVVKVLLENGANPDIADDQGWTPLMTATAMGSVDIIKDLIKYGADVNLQNENDETAMDLAVEYGQKDIVEIIQSELS